jgi:Cu/Ag efflux pump CusA
MAMLNVLCPLIGRVAAHWLTGLCSLFPGAIGVIAMWGIAVLEGGVSRLRPVLLKASATVPGPAPLLCASGVGSEVQRLPATVVVGGLASLRFLTPFVLPAMVGLFSRHSDKAAIV